MKQKITRILLILVVMIFSQSMFASHFAGADLTYRCLGGNDYEITFSFYRDCSGATEPSTVSVTFNCTTNSAFNFSATLNKVPGTGIEVTPGCSAMPTSCAGGASSQYGMREYVYRANVTLPPCNFWRMSYSLCCRNPSNTILNPGSQNGYIEATLNNLNAPCNSSPTFTNKPITIMCQGQTFCFNHGALDPNGDSLSYEMITPMNGAGTYVTWLTGYTATQPLPSNPPITCNPVTGDICMTPMMNIVSPMAVLIKQWRTINNVPTMIGTTMRDLQVNVVTCNNSLPQLSGMDTTLSAGYKPTDTTYFREICLGTTVNFNMYGFDADTFSPWNTGSPQKFSLNWNNGIPSGTFTVYHNNSDSAYANFYWIPNQSHVSNTPKCFTVTIQDQACPYFGTQTFSYCITVRGMFVDIGRDTIICKGESLTLVANADTTTKNYIWRLNGVPTGTPLTSNTYTFNSANYPAGVHSISIETNDGGVTTKCPGTDVIRVNVVALPNINLGNDTLICEGNSLTLDAGPGQIYAWNTGATTQTINLSNPTSQIYWVWVDGGNNTRCVDIDSIFVDIVPMPNFDLGIDTCSNASVTIAPDGLSTLHNWNYEWTGGSTGNNLTVNTSGNYTVTITNKPGSGCFRTDSRVVNIIDMSAWEAQNSGIDICTHQSQVVNAPAPPGSHTYAYAWYLDGSGAGSYNYYTLNNLTPGTHTLMLNAGGGCEGSIQVEARYCPLEPPNIITPNGDGYNDKFVITNLEYYPGSTIVIFNRWGKKVFESLDYQNDWGAKDNSDGIYYYVLRVKDGKDTELSGSITVMRN
jgi:gliding motility-associated-like protein